MPDGTALTAQSPEHAKRDEAAELACVVCESVGSRLPL